MTIRACDVIPNNLYLYENITIFKNISILTLAVSVMNEVRRISKIWFFIFRSTRVYLILYIHYHTSNTYM